MRLRCDVCDWTLWTETAADAPEIWLIHTSDRPADLTIWNRGIRDRNKAIEILCQPHTSPDGCDGTITRDIQPQPADAETAETAETYSQPTLA